MYSNIKLICMDMDGTLLGAGGVIPEINLYALREAARRGIRLALVSGRNYRFLMKNADEIGPDVAIVSGNGARIDEKVGGKCIYEGLFEPDYARQVCRTLWETGVYFEIYTESKNYVFNAERISEIHKRSLEMYLKNRQILGLEFPKSPEEATCDGIYKFVAFSDIPGMVERVKQALDENAIPHASSWWDNVEVMARGVDKGHAVRILADHCGIESKDVMVFGDHTNDLSLLSAAGCPVAMENGVDEVKAVAKIIAPKNTEGGVGRVILKYVLGMDCPDL
ncbi:MAG: HAD family phosphatase [Clostridia bacterium]|nr:HAD family phosphatase [Clostridia bacterium]